MPYLNVDEVESALAVAAAPPNQAFSQLIALPNLTWEGRQCHAIKIGAGAAAPRAGVYLIGGVHAREWGSPDILINFIERLSAAYRTNKGLRFGGQRFTAAQIQHIVTTLDLFVFPQVNPDGRHYSMTVDPMWRKNRRPAPPGQPNCAGVDINRNYDFLWNYPRFYDPHATVQSSTSPCQDIYIGPGAASEPETRNVVWLLDQHANIGYFMDLHSFSEDILYTWGDDDNQSVDPSMNFHNPAFDGKRGVTDNAGVTPQSNLYRDYIDPNDKAKMIALGTQMHNALAAVRGKNYKVVQSASGLYVTSGTSDDYIYSRHILDTNKPNVIAFTLEWGAQKPNDVAGSFHPLYSEMKQIIDDVTAGLIGFCLASA